MNLNDRFLSLALHGADWVLVLLVVGSVASVAVMVERARAYRGVARRDATLARVVGRRDSGRWATIRAAAMRRDAPAARMLARVFDAGDEGTDELATILDGALASERVGLERGLGLLGTVAANAPFVGLLGTVLEILRVFNDLGRDGLGSGAQTSAVMTGISEALVATGVGLLVAIPASIAYNVLLRRVDDVLARAREVAAVGLERFGRTSAGGHR